MVFVSIYNVLLLFEQQMSMLKSQDYEIDSKMNDRNDNDGTTIAYIR